MVSEMNWSRSYKSIFFQIRGCSMHIMWSAPTWPSQDGIGLTNWWYKWTDMTYLISRSSGWRDSSWQQYFRAYSYTRALWESRGSLFWHFSEKQSPLPLPSFADEWLNAHKAARAIDFRTLTKFQGRMDQNWKCLHRDRDIHFDFDGSYL